jgi:acetate kinase
MPSQRQLAAGEAQRIGPPTAKPSVIIYKHGRAAEQTTQVAMRDHKEAFTEVMNLLAGDKQFMPDAIAHRFVHGGTIFGDMVIDDAAIARLPDIAPLAPIHNPPAIALVQACNKQHPALPQVLVFDTAFHATIPPRASTYAIGRQLRQDLGLRKFGFHGTSHQYVAAQAAAMLNKPLAEFSGVSCHLGSGGASLCAIVNGKSIDNTMGYSPLQGLVMSTRCGDLDPAVTLGLLASCGGDCDQVERILNSRSGILGLTGKSSDIRDSIGAYSGTGSVAAVPSGTGILPVSSMGVPPMSVAGVPPASTAAPGLGRNKLATQIYLWRIRKYLGAYLAAVGPADAVIFTDTIGQALPAVRWAVCTDMEFFGLSIDPAKNNAATAPPADVAAADSKVRILVIETNEELAIARRSFDLLQGHKQ